MACQAQSCGILRSIRSHCMVYFKTVGKMLIFRYQIPRDSMTLQTYTIQEAESQFRFWLNRVHASQQSVILTTDDTQEPMALLMPVTTVGDDSHEMLVRHVELLESIVPLWQQQLKNASPTQDFAGLCQTQLRIFFERIPDDLPTLSTAVMLLRLAVRTLKAAATVDNLTAFQNALAILKTVELTSDDLDKIDQILLNAGLEIQAELGDPELLNAYVDAL